MPSTVRQVLQREVMQRLPRLPDFVALTRLDRPIGIGLLLWPTLWGLWLGANGLPSLHHLVVFVGGVVLMRSAGCVINDYADRNLDGLVERTRHRPMATGRVGETEALVLCAVLCLLALLLVLTTNRPTIGLACCALVAAGIYPFMKRVTYIPQAFLGVAFSFGIPMAFAATTGKVPDIAWLLFVANVLWTVAYDTLYAMVDRDDDVKAGIRSTAILFGSADRVMVGLLQGLVLLCLVIAAGRLGFGMVFHAAIVLAGAMFARQQWMIRKRDRDACFKAFLDNNLVGAAVFAGIALEIGLA